MNHADADNPTKRVGSWPNVNRNGRLSRRWGHKRSFGMLFSLPGLRLCLSYQPHSCSRKENPTLTRLASIARRISGLWHASCTCIYSRSVVWAMGKVIKDTRQLSATVLRFIARPTSFTRNFSLYCFVWYLTSTTRQACVGYERPWDGMGWLEKPGWRMIRTNQK